MNTLTLRQIPLPVEKRLRQLAKESHKSLNKTTIEVLSKAVGLGTDGKKSMRKLRDVKSVLRKWTDEEYLEFQKNSQVFEVIDQEMWRK